MNAAHRLFGEMPQRNCFSWNTLIEGYLKLGDKETSLEIFNSMPYKNDFSWNILISAFAKAGDLKIARRVFNDMPIKNGIAWNSMIHSYTRNDHPKEAIKLFMDLNSIPYEKSRADTFVLATVLGACTNLADLDYGKQIHTRIIVEGINFDSVLCSSLINFYGKCGDLDSANCFFDSMDKADDFSLSSLISGYANCGKMNHARQVLNRLSSPSVVLWNTVISGYNDNTDGMGALAIFNEMRRKGNEGDFSTLASVLSACTGLLSILNVKQMHGHACKFGVTNDVIIATALIDAYSKCKCPKESCMFFDEIESYDTILLNSMINVYSNCGRIENAKWVFERIPNKSLISWNSMIVGLSQNGCPIDALNLFTEMHKLDLSMDMFSLASVISTCGSISALGFGEQVFARAIIIGLEFNQIIATSLIDFYCKCGFVQTGRKVFDSLIKSDEVSWNSLLMGYATNGQGFEALNLFEDMRRANVDPTTITFTAILSVCNHCGLVKEGRDMFFAMKRDYDIDPCLEHYSCMIDLFARAGFLEEAMNLIEKMPFKADSSIWTSILRGCVCHGDKIVGKKVAKRIIEIEPENTCSYVQLSTIFATSEDWENSAKVRNLMREKKIQKTPGHSWVDT